MGGIKALFHGVFRIAMGITGAVVSLSLLGLIIFGGWYGYTELRNRPLAETRTWPELKIKALDNTRLTLVTMWKDGNFHYQFRVVGYPKILAEARDNPTGKIKSATRKTGFTLHFMDKSGFRVFDHHVTLNEMVKIVDSTAKGTGMQALGDTWLESDNYRRADSWTVTWNFRNNL